MRCKDNRTTEIQKSLSEPALQAVCCSSRMLSERRSEATDPETARRAPGRAKQQTF